MLLQGKFKSKHILRLALLVAILIAIFLGIVSIVQSRIFVSGLFEPSQECLSQSDEYKKWSCFRSYFERITNEVSANAAMAEAIKLKTQRITSTCHLSAHFIGRANLEKHNFDVEKTFSTCVAGCSDGCFHGVMEGYISNEGDLSNLTSTIKNVCNSLGTDGRQQYRCIHGVGHGLLAHSYLSLQEAISGCAALGSDKNEATICMGGLLMENMTQYIYLDHTEDHLRKILPEICAPVESIVPEHMNDCISNITLGLMDYTGYDIERTEDLCEELQQQEYIQNCKDFIPRTILDELPSSIDLSNFFKNQHIESLFH